MITPEFSKDAQGEYVLIANHCVETQQCLQLSLAFNRARIEHAIKHLPPHLTKCCLVYDVRGQEIDHATIESIRSAFSDIEDVRILN